MIAIRPPEYFPDLSFIALATQVKTFVLADTFQYSRQSRQNRSKLRNPDGWQWISVPLQSRPPGCVIAEAMIENHEPWQRKHWRALEYNYRSTPYFEFYEPALRPIVLGEWTRLADLSCATALFLFEQFEIDAEVLRASEMQSAPTDVREAARALGSDALLSLPEAAPHDAESGCHVSAAEFVQPEYRQNFEGFEPEMSAVDLLFNYGPRGVGFIERAVKFPGS